jgi:hypothetical protein
MQIQMQMQQLMQRQMQQLMPKLMQTRRQQLMQKLMQQQGRSTQNSPHHCNASSF